MSFQESNSVAARHSEATCCLQGAAPVGAVEPAVLGQSPYHGRVAQGEAGAAEDRVTDSSSEPGSLAEKKDCTLWSKSASLTLEIGGRASSHLLSPS